MTNSSLYSIKRFDDIACYVVYYFQGEDMKVVLLKDVKGTGKKGDIVTVAYGFGKNFLLKNGYASLATNSILNENKGQKEAEAYHKEQERLKAVELGKRLESVKLTLAVKCGENGKVFGSVTNKELSEELSKQGLDVPKNKIELPAPLKTTGLYTISARLHPTVNVKFKVEIIPQ